MVAEGKFEQSGQLSELQKQIPENLSAKFWQMLLERHGLAGLLFLLHEFPSAKDEDFSHLELTGICLRGFNLTKANFEGTDLGNANLRRAILRDAKLVGTRLDGADLSYAQLTGICIQNWQVTETTKFEGVECEYVYLTPENQKKDIKTPKDEFFKEFPFSFENKDKIIRLKAELDKIDAINDKVVREYRLNQAAEKAKRFYSIEADRFYQMFEDYCKQKLQAKRKSSWWQNFLWFKVEPFIKNANQLTEEMAIFPLLGQLGKLSILIAVMAYVNNALQPPKLNVEEQYHSWQALRSDNEKIRGISQFALEQLRDKGSTLKKIQVPGKADLNEINLSNADLRGASLEGVTLKKANLSGANLQEANLSRADLTEAFLGYQYLSHSDQGNQQSGKELFITSIRSALPRVLRRGANLQKANLQGANLTKADLQEADLQKANLQGANLQGANLQGAKNLGEVTSWKSTNLDRVDLQNFKEEELEKIKNNKLEGAFYITQIYLPDGLKPEDLGILPIKNRHDLRGINLSNVDLKYANLQKADLREANLQNADLREAELQGADLREAKLQGAKLKGAKYSSATKFPKGFKPKDEGMAEINGAVKKEARSPTSFQES